MSSCNTSFNIIINEQILKLSNVRSAIKLILEKTHDSDVASKLKLKFDEVHGFIDKLTKLKDALNYQVNLCSDIKKISGTLNLLVEQITNISEDESHKTEDDNHSLTTKTNATDNNSSSDSTAYYTPVQHKDYDIKPTRLISLDFRNFEIPPLTAEEFSTVPKYMLGRITLEGINKFVDVVNKTLKIKYTILSKSKMTLKGPDLQQYRDYKHQETAETKGKFFITELDIARQQNKKNLEKSTYNLLVILRHTKRLYENRTGRLLRFIVH